MSWAGPLSGGPDTETFDAFPMNFSRALRDDEFITNLEGLFMGRTAYLPFHRHLQLEKRKKYYYDSACHLFRLARK
jgi:hypothetical protein